MNSVALLFALAAMFAVGTQIFWFLQGGIWVGIDVIDMLQFLHLLSNEGVDSLSENWKGLYKILRWIPASGTLFAAAVAAAITNEANK